MELFRTIIRQHKLAEQDEEVMKILRLNDQPQEQQPEQSDDVENPYAMLGQADQEPAEEPEDPNRAGLIRTIPKSHLIYKRQQEDGTYEELWIYNVDDLNSQVETRKAILAGTDIPTNKQASPDGKQSYVIWTAGNAEMLKIIGLQN